MFMFGMRKQVPMQPTYMIQSQNRSAFTGIRQTGQPFPVWMQQTWPPMQGYYPMAPGPQGLNWQGGMGSYGGNSQPTYQLFENPLQPQEETHGKNGFPYGQQSGFLNPYPQHAYQIKQAKGIQSVMNSFKNQEGTIDVNKMLDTAGQMMNAVTQVSSMVKGLGGFFKA